MKLLYYFFFFSSLCHYSFPLPSPPTPPAAPFPLSPGVRSKMRFHELMVGSSNIIENLHVSYTRSDDRKLEVS